MKLTLVGTPKQVIERDTYVAFEMTAKATASLPKGLPPAPKEPMIWIALVAKKQWTKVADSLAEHPDTAVIIEGYPAQQGTKHVLLASAATTVAIQKARQDAQRAAAVGS